MGRSPERGARRGPRTPVLGPLERVAAAVVAGLLAAGLALTLMSPSAWPVPAVVVPALLALWVRGTRQAATVHADDCRVAAEAAVGIAQVEAWLAQQNRR